MDDLQLVRAALEADVAARDELGRRLRCVSAILASLDRRSGDGLGREDRLDLGQETLLRLWTRLSTYSGAVPLEAWARGYCVNLHRNQVRKQVRRAWLQRGECSADDVPAAESCRPDHGNVWAELARLGPREAHAIRLKCLDELTFAEAGARLGLSPSTVKTSYYRGLRRLAAHLGRRGAQARLPPRAGKCETPRQLGDNHAPAGTPCPPLDERGGRPGSEAR